MHLRVLWPAPHARADVVLRWAAIKYGVLAADIKRVNKLFSQVVFPGAVLKLPPGATMPAARVSTQDALGARDTAEPTVGEHEASVLMVYDTTSVWDGEAGFMCLKADSSIEGNGQSDKDACTWVGSLFAPAQDCCITGVSLNLRLVEGDGLAFRIVLATWDDGSTVVPSSNDASQGGWFTPAAKIPGQGGGEGSGTGNVSHAGGLPGDIIFSSDVMHVQKASTADAAYRTIDCSFLCSPPNSTGVFVGYVVTLPPCEHV